MSKKRSSNKNKKNNKRYIIIGSVIGIIFILLIAFFLLIRSSTTPAYLNVEQGGVQVNFGSGWLSAKDGMELSLEDQVRTLDDGSAILVLYESVIVNLKENTEVSIAELAEDRVKIEQESGTTWNKFTKLAGVASYEVQTPNTVATVRGTEFEMTLDSCLVGSGNVEYRAGDQKYKLNANMKARFRDGRIIQEKLTADDKRRIIQNKKKVMSALRKLRQRQLDKHPRVYGMAKSLAGIDDKEAQVKIQKMDWGRIDEDQLVERAPMKLESVDKFVRITKQIKKEKTELAKLGYNEPKPDWMTGIVKDDGQHGDGQAEDIVRKDSETKEGLVRDDYAKDDGEHGDGQAEDLVREEYAHEGIVEEDDAYGDRQVDRKVETDPQFEVESTGWYSEEGELVEQEQQVVDSQI